MYTCRLGIGTFASLVTLQLCAGCSLIGGEEKKELPPGASAANEVGRPLMDFELPVSLRIQDRAPTDARTIEATDEQLRIDGDPVVALEKGRVAAADQANGMIPKLEARLRSPARSTLALRIQANVPYETAALVLNTARAAGVSNAAFAVRETGVGKKTGWLNADGYVMATRHDDLPPITAVKPREWISFADIWQETFDGCRTAPNGNCAYLPGNIAQGGTLKIELFASGHGINVDFYRRGLTPEQEADEDKVQAQILARKKEDVLQGRITHDEMVEALLLGDPSTYALFQFRNQEALRAPSALTKTMAPACHKERCGVLLAADKITPMLNVVSMVGAAFPDGTPMPAFAFEQPWTERPKPAVLTDFIEQQMKK
jgi:biopolymer transport protein ExbD